MAHAVTIITRDVDVSFLIKSLKHRTDVLIPLRRKRHILSETDPYYVHNKVYNIHDVKFQYSFRQIY